MYEKVRQMLVHHLLKILAVYYQRRYAEQDFVKGTFGR